MYIPATLYRSWERLRRRPGRREWPSSFADRLTHPVPSTRAVVQLYRDRGMRPDLGRVGTIDRDADARWTPAGTARAAVTWIGHASCVVQIGGLVVLTDPVWSRRLPGVRARFTDPGLPLADVPVDAVVISHNHFDHLDAPTIRRLPRHVPVLVPGGLGWWFRRLGFERVTELDWWESAGIGGVTFDFVPVHHWSRRGAFDTCRSLWGGWLMSTGETRVFFGGDSAYGPRFAEIGERHPGIDVALMPVGAYQPRWFMRPLHMNPAEAVRACGDLGARRMVPIHWGTFALSAEDPSAPPGLALRAWQEAGRDPGSFWALAVGETRRLEADPVPNQDTMVGKNQEC